MNHVSASQPKTNIMRGAVWKIAIGETLVWAGLYYSFAALFLSWERDLGWGKADLAIGFTAAVLTAAVSSPLAGRMIDAGFGKWLLSFGAVLGALALGLLSIVQTQIGFLALWMVIGVAQSACLYEPCFALVTRTAGDQARGIITRISLAAGFASPIAFPAGAALANAFGWRVAVIIIALVIAFVAAPLLFSGVSHLERNADGNLRQTKAKGAGRAAVLRAMGTPAFWLIAIAFSFLALNHGLLVSHIIPLLTEKGFGEVVAVTIASVIGPMQVIGRLLMFAAGRFAKTMGMTMICFGGVIMAAIFLVFSDGNVVLAVAFAASQGAAFGLVSILKPSVISDIFGRSDFGSISGWLALPYLVGSALGPLVGAVLWQIGGYDLAIVVAAIMALFGLGCVFLLARVHKALIVST